MKTYTCYRCGYKFRGMRDRCPACAQLIIYRVRGKYTDALGNQVVLDKQGHIVDVIPNPRGPRPIRH